MALDGSNDAYLDVGDIAAYVERAIGASVEAHEVGRQRLLENVRARARVTPRWYRLADVIETWTDEGYLRIGVRQRDYLSLATVAEYGDDYEPPAPLIRVLTEDTLSAQEAMAEYMRMTMGPGVQI